MSFDFTVSYRPGSKNQDADGLSRQAWDKVLITEAVDLESTRTSQLKQLGGDVGMSPTEKDASPVTTEKDASPATTEKDASPATTEKDASPATTEKDASPASTGELVI